MEKRKNDTGGTMRGNIWTATKRETISLEGL